MTNTHNALDLTVQQEPNCPPPPIQKPTWHQLPLYMDPLLLVANTGYLFKLVHLQTPGADIWWLLKHITRIVSKRMVRILLEFFLVTVRNSSCGKVMFSQVSVCPRGEGCTPSCQADITPPRQTRPPPDGYCSGRYASYWNAFLLKIVFDVLNLNGVVILIV